MSTNNDQVSVSLDLSDKQTYENARKNKEHVFLEMPYGFLAKIPGESVVTLHVHHDNKYWSGKLYPWIDPDRFTDVELTGITMLARATFKPKPAKAKTGGR